MTMLRIRYEIPNFKHDKRRKYGWRAFETFPKGMLIECWMTDEDKPSLWIGTSMIEDKTIEKMLLDAGEPAKGETFEEIKLIQGFTYLSGSMVVDYALKKGWMTEEQVIEALTSSD